MFLLRADVREGSEVFAQFSVERGPSGSLFLSAADPERPLEAAASPASWLRFVDCPPPLVVQEM